MNTTHVHPLHHIGALALALRERMPVVRQSATLLCQWYHDTLAWLAALRAAVRAIDDDLEQTTARLSSLRPDIAASLRNDPPATRRRLLRAIDAEIRAAHRTHARTEAAAESLNLPR